MSAAPVATPWFQPKSKKQYAVMMLILLGAIAGLWIGAVYYVKKATGAMPPPVIQKARNLFEEKRNDEAIALLTDTVRQIETTRGPEDPSLVKHFDLLATIYGATKRESDAEPLWRRSYEMRRKMLGPDHPETLGSGDRLALSLIAQGKYPEADPLLRKSLAHREGYYGVDDPGILASLNHMAELFLAQKMYREAEPFATRAVKIGRGKTGLVPPAFADSLRQLGAILAGLEKYEDAAPLYDQSIKYKVRQLPDAPHIPPKQGQISHGDFSDLCKEAAAVYRKAGKEKEAKELEAKAAAVLKPKE
ncbi:MAG: tetratricopeptide repeat protein [Planctomycetes bacterium]|nr:tetratricopeptide repeat protein [Planctomycetota bacterium]